jgi:phosphatidylserine/phosphatidylglycerophosphate/cardiolipin synthase-like enzyme
VYDAITSASAETNGTAIDKALIAHLCKPRTFGKIMHNKFLVLTRDGGPIAVWTGSTNISENGIFGHLNCGHIVSDAGVAGEYLKYFRQLETGVDLDSEKDWIMVNNPAPPDPWTDDLMSIFSPHRGQKVLNWYASIAGGAQEALFMTFAFGMNERFKNVYRMDDPVLRVALMEKAGSPRNLEKEKVEIDRIRRRRNVVVAIGNRILTNSFDRWLAERPGLTRGIQWVHTKFMLVDPLSDTPTTITGSANFSEDSTGTNNENMLVIRGDTRVADIYLGEFMRLHTHYAFREAVANAGAWGNADWQPAHLVPDDSWQRDYFTPGDARYLRRRYFAQSA